MPEKKVRFAEFELDLNECFNVTQPGRYRFRLVFSSQDGGFANGSSQEIQFQLAGSTPK